MSVQRRWRFNKILLGAVLISLFSLTMADGQPSAVPYEAHGSFAFGMVEGWRLNRAESSGNLFVFNKSDSKIIIDAHTTPVVSAQDMNRVILDITQSLRANGEFIEQRRPASTVFFLGQNQCQRLTIKSRANNQRRFIFLPVVDGELFKIEVYDPSATIEPGRAVMYFLALIHRVGDRSGADSAMVAAEKWKPSPAEMAANGHSAKDVKDDIASEAMKPPARSEDQASKIPEDPAYGSEEEFSIPQDILLETGKVIKEEVPLVKFSRSDPCDPNVKENGMPWASTLKGAEITVPSSVNTTVTPIIPELDNLSTVNYNAAVSIAFEAMRLVYGPMPEEEYKSFESAWMPLFDYPTQSVIDYLNVLNPLVSQFLSCREAYVRTLNDIHIVLLDAAIAVELDERYAWEAAMAEAGLYSSVIKTLDATMKQLAAQIEKLGNPPNPLAAKCEAQRRYRRMLPQKQTGLIGECWAGYSRSDIQSPELETLYEPVFRHVSNAKGKFIVLELVEDGPIEHLESDLDWLSHIRVQQADIAYSPEEGMNIEHGEIGKFTYPNIKQYKNTSYTKLLMLSEMSNVSEDHEHYDELIVFSNTCKRYLSRSQTAGFFFKRGILWSYEDKWSQYQIDENGLISDEALADFEEELRQEMREYLLADDLKSKERAEKIKELDDKNNIDNALDSNSDQPASDSLAIKEQQAIQETINFHSEMIEVIRHNLNRDKQERNEVAQSLRSARTASERENIESRLKSLDWRIINHYSNIQHEQDMINSYRTGQVVRTRSVFDDFAHQKFIENIKTNAARMDATKRVGDRMDFLIRLLPEEQQAKARAFARENLDANTLASGDIEKAKKIANAIHQQVIGYALEEQAQADHDVITADQNELMAQSVIAVTGSVFIGLGTAQLASTYGAQTAATYYGGKAIGAIWGGTTGYLSGGPKDAVLGAMTFWSPLGASTAQFIDGFEKAGHQPNADISTRIWEGVKSAGTGYLMGKAIQLGAQLTARGAMVMFGENSRLFKPIVYTTSQRTKIMLDQLRTQQQKLNAGDEIKTFQKLETQLALLKRDPLANAQKIGALEKEINQLAAGLNMSYHAKWHMKYKAHPLVRSKFDRRVQANYSEMNPGMIDRMDKMGYDMSNIEFRPIRNSSSAGSSSMDLDYVPYKKGTNQQMNSSFIRKKNGSIVTLEQFQSDAQKSMNVEYREITGLSATASDMQVTTAIHKEAYTSTELLKSDIDFSKVTDDDLKSVSKVLEYKMEGIDKKQTLTHTTRMQAKAREASKEIQNMLLAKLRSDLQNARPGSPQQKQLQSDIRYWEDMLGRFKTIGTEETNPVQLIKLNQDIMHETGGRDVNGVIFDLMGRFK